MSQSALQLATGMTGVAKHYLLEVCTQVLQGPRFSSDLKSSCFSRTAAANKKP